MSDPRAEARRRALAFLARREYGVAELARRLAEKGVDRSLAEEVARSLAADGLASDRRFAEAFVAARVARGWGPLAIGRDLGQRGLEPATVEEALAAAGQEWPARMEAARVKRFGAASADPKERLRQARFLEYRGFPRELIRAWLQRG